MVELQFVRKIVGGGDQRTGSRLLRRYWAEHRIGDPDAPRVVSHAKAAANDAARLVGRQALQCHGAIGYTVEYDLHLWLKRAWALSESFGSSDQHRGRVADSVHGPIPSQKP